MISKILGVLVISRRRPGGNPMGCRSGGACRDRTDDPLLAKQVLSQLS